MSCETTHVPQLRLYSFKFLLQDIFVESPTCRKFTGQYVRQVCLVYSYMIINLQEEILIYLLAIKKLGIVCFLKNCICN